MNLFFPSCSYKDWSYLIYTGIYTPSIMGELTGFLERISVPPISTRQGQTPEHNVPSSRGFGGQHSIYHWDPFRGVGVNSGRERRTPLFPALLRGSFLSDLWLNFGDFPLQPFSIPAFSIRKPHGKRQPRSSLIPHR